MPRFAELGSETHGVHEGFVIYVPYGMPFEVPFYDDTLHVVGQDILWDTHHVECMEHADEQVLLLGIGKEFNKHLSAVMADHCKACDSVFVAVRVYDPCEAPVHLEGLPGTCAVAAATVSLRRNCLPLCRYKIPMSCNIPFYRRQASCEPDLGQPLKAHNRVGDSELQQIVQS